MDKPILSMDPTSSVLYSELILSLYPVLIKWVPTNLFTQLLSRFLVFVVMAFVLGPKKEFFEIWTNTESLKSATLHSAINIIHIFSSYFSFKNLSAGVSLSLFYLYPIFNIIASRLIFGEQISTVAILLIFVAFFGAYLVAMGHTEMVGESETERQVSKEWKGVIAAIIAALSETSLYIFTKSFKVSHSPYFILQHIYPLGLLGLIFYSAKNTQMVDTNISSWVPLILFNCLLGFTGYLQRFWSIPRVSTLIFSAISFLGIIMGYTWDITLLKEKISIKALTGGGLIALAVGVLRYFEIE